MREFCEELNRNHMDEVVRLRTEAAQGTIQQIRQGKCRLSRHFYTLDNTSNTDQMHLRLTHGTDRLHLLIQRFNSEKLFVEKEPMFSVLPEPGLSPAIRYFSCMKYLTS